MRLLVHPRWPGVVCPRDQDYIRSILEDFARRAQFDPEGLFIQASELSVGPLVTYSVGNNLAEHPDLCQIGSGFVEA